MAPNSPSTEHWRIHFFRSLGPAQPAGMSLPNTPGHAGPEAAQALLRGMQSQRFAIEFPSAFTRCFHVLRCLLYLWYFSLVRRATGL